MSTITNLIEYFVGSLWLIEAIDPLSALNQWHTHQYPFLNAYQGTIEVKDKQTNWTDKQTIKVVIGKY
jgi:hypothetical protein